MPLTAKGEKILSHLEEEYGAKHGKEVLYAGKNSGKFSGIDAAELDDADVEGAGAWMDANKPGTNQPEPSYNREAVQRAIEASKKPISAKEGKLIHALLKGRGDAAAVMSKLDAALSGASILDNRASMMCDDHRVIGGVGGPFPDPKTVRTDPPNRSDEDFSGYTKAELELMLVRHQEGRVTRPAKALKEIKEEIARKK